MSKAKIPMRVIVEVDSRYAAKIIIVSLSVVIKHLTNLIDGPIVK